MKKTRRAKTTNATVEAVKIYREAGILPKAVTLRFLALLQTKELKKLRQALTRAIENYELPATNGRARKRRQWAQLNRVESELQQRDGSRKQ